MKRFYLLFLTVLFTLASYAQKDTLRLKTGKTLIGQILDDDGSVVVIKVDGKTKSVSKSEIGKKEEEKKAVEVKALSFSSVITVNEQNKDILYAKAKQWIAENYKSAKDVIQSEDKITETIICKGSSTYNSIGISYLCFEGWINYTFKIQVKEGRLKLEMYDFVHKNSPEKSNSCNLGQITTADIYTDKGMNKHFQNKTWEDIKKQCETNFNTSVKSLSEVISKKEDNW